MIDLEKANEEALNRLLSAQPVLVDMGIAKDTIPGLNERTFLHAGPPIDWKNMPAQCEEPSSPVYFFEGWAKTPRKRKSSPRTKSL